MSISEVYILKFKTRYVVCALLSVSAALFAVFTAISIDSPTAENTVSAYVGISGDEGDFVLREYNGYVAVFGHGFEDIPMTVTNIEVYSLPSADREQLSEGIAVVNQEKLVMLLEDFNS